jgi:hypothetical protein
MPKTRSVPSRGEVVGMALTRGVDLVGEHFLLLEVDQHYCGGGQARRDHRARGSENLANS